jgi:tRNA(Arg) A34 adenosine deaminase TadA
MKYMKLAIKIAQGGDDEDKNYLLGCVALRQDNAIVVSTNVRTQTPEHSAHAEYRTLRKAGHGSILWIARVDRYGNLANAKPCKKCQALISNKLVKRVYYTITNDLYGVWDPQ